MSISSLCANGHSFQVRDDLLGKKVRCPHCSAVTLVGDAPAGKLPKAPAKGKSAAADPWEMNDPFEDEDEAPPKRSVVKTGSTTSPRSAAGKKKRSSKSSGSSSHVGLMAGGIAGVVVIGGGLWLWLGKSSGPAALAEPFAAAPMTPAAPMSPSEPGVPSAPADPANTAAPVLSRPPSALAAEVAALPFPPMSDPAYGPPPPEGMVVSRALVNATTETLLMAIRRDGNPGPPPDQLVKNVVMAIGKQRTEDPIICCIHPAIDAALLAGTPDMASLRREFTAALAAMGPAQVDPPAVVTASLPAFKKDELSGGMTAFLTTLMQAKLRKEKSPRTMGADPAPAPPNGSAPAASPPSAPTVPLPAFLDQKKTVGGKLEWSREVTLRKPAAIRLRISSTQRFSVLVISDKAYQAVKSDRMDQMTKQDLYFDFDPRNEPLEQTISLPAGSTWIMIKNESNSGAEIHLECYPG